MKNNFGIIKESVKFALENNSDMYKVKKPYIPLLENTPVGTNMYLMITNRCGTRAILREVQYAGFTTKIVERTYWEFKMRDEARWEEPEFTVNFTDKTKKTKISVVCKYYDGWTGDRAYDTIFHEELAAKVKGVKLTTFNEMFGDPDVYFSLDKDKIVDKFKNTGVIAALNQEKKDIDNALKNIYDFLK